MTGTAKCSPTEYRYLMVQAIRGDSDALGTILMAFRGPIESTVRKFLRKFECEQYVDDLVAETYLQAVVGFRRYDPKCNTIWPWLRRISSNVCLKWAKRNQVGMKSDGLWCNEMDDAGEPTEDNQFDDATAALWASDALAEPVRPPIQPTTAATAKARREKPPHTFAKRGGGNLKPVPPHVQRSRELYAQM